MPGIIVSRPIFNTLFKLAHEEGLSINAFLTKLLENSGPEAIKQASATRAAATDTVQPADIAGTEHDEQPHAGSAESVRPAEYDDEPEPATPGGAPGRRIGNSIWDKVVSMEGKRFATSRGKKFSYRVTGEYIIVKDSQARIPRSQFDKAQKMWPVTGPSRLVGVYAPSVVWAVMKEASEAEEHAPA